MASIHWRRVPHNLSIKQVAQAAIAHKLEVRWRGGTLHICKRGQWLEFMYDEGFTFWRPMRRRNLPTTRRPRSEAVRPTGTFFCECCGVVKSDRYMTIVSIEHKEYFVCGKCIDDVVSQARAAGARVAVLTGQKVG